MDRRGACAPRRWVQPDTSTTHTSVSNQPKAPFRPHSPPAACSWWPRAVPAAPCPRSTWPARCRRCPRRRTLRRTAASCRWPRTCSRGTAPPQRTHHPLLSDQARHATYAMCWARSWMYAFTRGLPCPDSRGRSILSALTPADTKMRKGHPSAPLVPSYPTAQQDCYAN